MSQKFYNILVVHIVCSAYISWPKQFKLWKVLTMVGSILVVGMLTCCALLHSMCELKAAQLNMQHIIISRTSILWVPTGLITPPQKQPKPFVVQKVKGYLIHCKVIRWSRNFALVARNLILFTNPSARVGYDTRSIFKRSLTGLNSEFSFS